MNKLIETNENRYLWVSESKGNSMMGEGMELKRFEQRSDESRICTIKSETRM